MIYFMKLKSAPFAKIADGQKTYELRLLDEKRKKVKKDDFIFFTCCENGKKLLTVVEEVIVKESFEGLFEKLELNKCGFDETVDIKTAAEMMEEYYTPEQQGENSAVAFKIKMVSEIGEETSECTLPEILNPDDLEGGISDEEYYDEGLFDDEEKYSYDEDYDNDDDFSYNSSNPLSPILYTLCFITNSISLGIFFQTSVYTHILGLTTTLSKVIFCILFFSTTILGYLTTFENRRTLINTLAIPCFPIGLYTVISYFRFYPIIMSVFIGIGAVIFIWQLIKYIILPIKRKLLFFTDLDEMIVSLVKKLGIVFAALLVMMAVIPSFGLPEIAPTVAPTEENTAENDNFIKENKDKLSKYTGDNWDKLDVNSRIDFLQILANSEKEDLGLPHSLTVKSVVLHTNTGAQYNHQDHTIEINYDYLHNCDMQTAIERLTHECRHAYQRALIALYQSSSSEYQKLYVFDSVPEFIENYEAYVSGENKNKYEEYYNQAVEIDARNYSFIATMDIMHALGTEYTED